MVLCISRVYYFNYIKFSILYISPKFYLFISLMITPRLSPTPSYYKQHYDIHSASLCSFASVLSPSSDRITELQDNWLKFILFSRMASWVYIPLNTVLLFSFPTSSPIFGIIHTVNCCCADVCTLLLIGFLIFHSLLTSEFEHLFTYLLGYLPQIQALDLLIIPRQCLY